LPRRLALGAGALLLAGSAIYLYIQSQSQAKTITVLTAEKEQLFSENASTTQTLLLEQSSASSTIAELTARLAALTEELEDVEDDLRQEKNKNDDFEDQIKEISGTVGILDKLSKTDEELLQKYSRTYFLNENFIPMKLEQIDQDYVLTGKKDQYFHGDAVDFLTDMIDDAKDDGLDLKIVSAYRSFDEQEDIKGQFTQVYGTGSNTFSADQGYSEHQLGTTVDLTNPTVGGAYMSFKDTAEYEWLLTHAHRYGFILSYPEGNTFYIYEPWHWRFVGVDLAGDLHRENATFYDWDQRKIDEYLVSIFD
jgi:D-alanyl-D-alanine carboxypeptidase